MCRPMRLRSIEHARRLLGRKGDALAEGVDRIGQTFAGECGQHLAADLVDEGILVAVRLRRQGMGAEEGGGDGDGTLAA